mgnify:CR=1 FL=1
MVSALTYAVTYTSEYCDVKRIALGVTWLHYLEDLARALASGELEGFRDDYRVLRISPRHRRPTVQRQS